MSKNNFHSDKFMRIFESKIYETFHQVKLCLFAPVIHFIFEKYHESVLCLLTLGFKIKKRSCLFNILFM